MPVFTAQRLRQLSVDIFQAAEVPPHEARIVADHLVESNLMGLDSHGVIRIAQYIPAIQSGIIRPGAKPDLEQETPSSARINGRGGFGQVIAKQAMELAIEKACVHTVSAVSVYNCHHTGRLGAYTSMAAASNMVGMMMGNASGAGQLVTPFGGIAPRLSTNPFSIAAPTGKATPILLDMATSVTAEGKLRAARNSGKSVPEGYIIDHQGNPTTDPNQFYGPPSGALLPLGGRIAGHKGYSLSFMVDLLVGTLSTAGCCRPGMPYAPPADGALMMVLNVQSFTGLDTFFEQVAELVAHVKSSPLAAGFQEILVPGQKEVMTREKRLKEGILVDEGTWRQIETIGMELGVIPKTR